MVDPESRSDEARLAELSAAEPDPAPAEQPIPRPATNAAAAVAPAAPEPVTTVPEAPTAAAPEPLAPASVEITALAPADDVVAEAEEEAYTAALWSEEAVACPRDWVEVGSDRLRGSASSECRKAEPIVPPATVKAQPLETRLPERVLEITALAPTIPLPGADDAKDKPKAQPKKAGYARRRSDWPASPPPDCGSKHAYWRFTNRKTGAKEWYCK